MPSTDTIPYSLHSSLQGTEKGFSLTFHGQFRVRWLKNGQQKRNETRTDVKYNFVEAADFKRFQEDFRDKRLIGTYNIETIKSQYSKRHFEASNQDLKIWCSRDLDQTHTISFFANHLKEHMEFPLDWFATQIDASLKKKTIHMTFLEVPGKPLAAVRPQSLFSRKSRASAAESSTASHAWSAVGSIASSPRGSISTTSTGMSSVGPTQSRVHEMARWAEKFKEIYVQFSPDDESNDEDEVHEDSKLNT